MRIRKQTPQPRALFLPWRVHKEEDLTRESIARRNPQSEAAGPERLPVTHSLHLTINAVVTVDGERFPRSLNVLNREIEVEITNTQRVVMFVSGNRQWLWTMLAFPIALWVWGKRRKKQ